MLKTIWSGFWRIVAGVSIYSLFVYLITLIFGVMYIVAAIFVPLIIITFIGLCWMIGDMVKMSREDYF